MRVVITGMGLIDALGLSPDESFDCYLADNNPIGDVTNLNDFAIKTLISKSFYVKVDPSLDFLPTSLKKGLPKNARYGIYAVNSAINDAGLEPSDNVSVVFSSLFGGDDARETEMEKLIRGRGGKLSPRNMAYIPHDFTCSFISNFYKFRGNNTSVYSACATGIVSLDYAVKILLEEDNDYVIVGGSDAGIDQTNLNFFDTLNALSRDRSVNASRPFDKSRNGFVMGEGAGALVLEREDRALARGAKIYGYVGGIGLASDAYNAVAPDPNGYAAKASMTKAMAKAGITSVDYVNAHATSTPAGDQVEYNAILDVCGQVYTSSLKGKIGHTMAAAGIIETIYTLKMMERGVILHNSNLDNPLGNEIPLITQPLKTNISSALNNSFGFGGKCASVCLMKG